MSALPTVPGGRLTDYFGEPRYGDIHRGIDLAGITPGTTPPIYAVEGGRVEFVNKRLPGKNGNNIGIRTNGGGLWFYGHIEAIKVKQGQKVAEGQRIATMGKNGLSATAGIHLHLELWWGPTMWQAVDPIPYLAKNGVQFDGKERGSRLIAPATITAQAAATITLKPLPKEDILAKLDNDDYEEIAKAVWRYDQQGKTPQAWHFQKNVGAIVWAHKLKSAFDGKLYQAASFLTVNNKHGWLLPGVQRLLEKLGTQAGVTKEDLDAAVSQVNDHTTETMADAVVDVEVTVKGKEATA